MDIYEYLKLDHKYVNKLFKQFDTTKNPERQIEIMTYIAQELLIHAKSEQETFYQALKQHPRALEQALHGKEEHEEIEQQISDILETERVDANWRKKVKKLEKLVSHHVSEEEGSIFRKAKKVLSDDEAYILKEHMHYLKQDLLRRLEKKSLRA